MIEEIIVNRNPKRPLIIPADCRLVSNGAVDHVICDKTLYTRGEVFLYGIGTAIVSALLTRLMVGS